MIPIRKGKHFWGVRQISSKRSVSFPAEIIISELQSALAPIKL